MDITDPAWITVIIAALGILGTAGRWIAKRAQRCRDVMPIVRAEWCTGPLGHTAHIELVNRLDEDLRIISVCAKAPLVSYIGDGGTPWAPVEPERVVGSRCVDPDWIIPPRETSRRSFEIDDAVSSKYIILRISSSNASIRDRSLIVR